jgi:hypothetical protein
LGSSAGEQLWAAALGSSFGQLSGPALRQLRVTTLEFWGMIFLIIYIFIFFFVGKAGFSFRLNLNI